MAKILIIGFQRSGTTMLRHIFSKHPQVRKMFHETLILNKFSDIQKLYNKYNKLSNKNIWGEKVPYFKGSPNKYCKKWIKTFPDDYKIIHIVRHPFDVINSNSKTFGNDYEKTVSLMYKNLPKVLNSKFDCFNIKYEDLLINQKESMEELFSYCLIDSSEYTIENIQNSRFRYFPKLNEKRAFSYKKSNFIFDDKRIKNLVQIINKKIPQQEYKLE